MLSDIIRELTKVKKKFGNDVPVLYVCGDNSEMDMLQLQNVNAIYMKRDLLNNKIITNKNYDSTNFIKITDYDEKIHSDDFSIVVIISEDVL